MGFELKLLTDDDSSEPDWLDLTVRGMGVVRGILLSVGVCDERDFENPDDEVPGKVLIDKLRYNDGFWLSPAECSIIADTLTTRAGETWICSVADFFRRCSTQCGCWVS